MTNSTARRVPYITGFKKETNITFCRVQETKLKAVYLRKLGGLLSTSINKKIELDIYSDEIFNAVDPFDNTNWMYLGALFVPSDYKTEVLKNLKDLRCIKNHNWNTVESDCPEGCKFHEENNTEIHFKEIHRSSARYMIAKYWISFSIRKLAKNTENYYIVIYLV